MLQPSDVWSFRLCRWRNVQIRLHVFFLLFGIITVYLAWKEDHQNYTSNQSMVLALIVMGLLFVSVLVHEFGHCLIARKLGARVRTLVLGPIGGLRPIRIPGDPQSEFLAVLAGPMATLGLCMVCLLSAIIIQPSAWNGVTDIFRPFRSIPPIASGAGYWGPLTIRLGLWVNAWLFILNLIPAFPFDGGRALTALIRIIRPEVSLQRAVRWVAHLARLVALGLTLCAVLIPSEAAISNGPPRWLGLLLLSVFVFFSARVEDSPYELDEEDIETLGYDFSQGYTSLERSESSTASSPGVISRWLERRRKKHQAEKRRREADEDRQADLILAELHKVGMEGLTQEERALLNRVSQRWRARERDA